MKAYRILLTLAIILTLVSCVENGTGPKLDESDFYGIKMAANPTFNDNTNQTTYQVELGGAGLRDNQYTEGPAIQLQYDQTPRALAPSSTGNTFIFTFVTLPPRTVNIKGWGYYYRDDNGVIHWKVREKEWDKVKANYLDANQNSYIQGNYLSIRFDSYGIEAGTITAENGGSINAEISLIKYQYGIDENIVLTGIQPDPLEPVITKWTWEFKDEYVNETKQGKEINYSFRQPGTKTIRLIAESANGQTSQTEITINVVVYPYHYNEYGVIDHKAIGDEHVGFRFNYTTGTLTVSMNFNDMKDRKDRPYVYGSFNGGGKAWEFYSAQENIDQDGYLYFNLYHHNGWGSIDIHLRDILNIDNLEFLDMAFGFSDWYDKYEWGYVFSGNFDHMNPQTNNSIYLEKYSEDNTFDYHVLVYSSGQIVPHSNNKW